jgi:glyoxylase I family protein
VARRGVHHLDLVVSSLERSLPLYRELLEPLGYTRAGSIVGERGEEVWYLSGEGVTPVSLRQVQSASGPYDRYAVGLHHLAFSAESRELVDDRLAWAKANRLEIENEPQEWPYMPGYYAGFFHDPDGLKLEVVHVPPRR